MHRTIPNAAVRKCFIEVPKYYVETPMCYVGNPKCHAGETASRRASRHNWPAGGRRALPERHIAHPNS